LSSARPDATNALRDPAFQSLRCAQFSSDQQHRPKALAGIIEIDLPSVATVTGEAGGWPDPAGRSQDGRHRGLDHSGRCRGRANQVTGQNRGLRFHMQVIRLALQKCKSKGLLSGDAK
jgi:hypothetical protein